MKQRNSWVQCGSLVFLIACGGQDPVVLDTPEANEDAIIGGTRDTGDPSIVVLFTHLPGENTGYICTATVISSTRLLTAAHCVDPEVVGRGYVTDAYAGTTLSSSATKLSVAGTVYDPLFDQNALENGHDVAIVKLSRATTLRPIPYNTAPLTSSARGGAARIVGYGSNTHRDSGAGTKRTANTTIRDFDAGFLLIGDTNRQSCHGDSGGPALRTVNGTEQVVGIVSFGQDRSETSVCYYGGYYTRTDAVADFIRQNL